VTPPKPVRIALWSGPRNISTAMMRAFENRGDTAVIDEPFYAAFLAETGIDHPLREEVLAAQSADRRAVAAVLLGPVPGGRPIFYQKHMAHHMTGGDDLSWMAHCRSAFLIRSPPEVLASYAAKRRPTGLEDIGFVRQAELFDREAQRLGTPPPVIEARDVLTDPRRALTALCAALDVPFAETMLGWPPGPRVTDGAWAPAWYDSVERSTGFARPRPPVSLDALEEPIRALAEAAAPYYERLARHKLAVGGVGET